MPTHQASATQISLPTDPSYQRARMVFTIEVTGWFSANTRTILGMVSVGTNAELINGKNISGYEKADAPSTDFAVNPGMTASHVSASVNNPIIPATASHSRILALVRKPIKSATNITTTTVSALETSDVQHMSPQYRRAFDRHGNETCHQPALYILKQSKGSVRYAGCDSHQ